MFDTGILPVHWLPGLSTETFDITLPMETTPGEYRVEAGIPGISLANEAASEDDFHEMGHMMVNYL